jgi:hypothetical protein
MCCPVFVELEGRPMFRRMLFALAVILVLAIRASAQEAEALDWTAWLYESDSGRITLVDSDGASREFTLPLAEAFNAYEQAIAVAPSGSHVAYIAVIPPPNHPTASFSSTMSRSRASPPRIPSHPQPKRSR